MKSKFLLAAAACIAFVAASCSKDDAVDSFGQTPITVCATHPSAKVVYSESAGVISARWETGDKLAIVFNGQPYELNMQSGAGTNTATFSGTIPGTPTNGEVLTCRVIDVNANNGFLGQGGTLAAATSRGVLQGTVTYQAGQNLSCNNMKVDAAMLKFTVPSGTTGPLTYKSGGTEIASAAIPAGATTVYMAVPSGSYTGLQLLQLEGNQACILSTDGANFTAGKTYSKEVTTAHVSGYYDVTDNNNSITVENGDILYGQQMYDQHALTTITIRDGATVTFDETALMGCDIIFEGDATLIFTGGNYIESKGDGSIPISVPVGQEVNIVIEKNSSLLVADWETTVALGGVGAFGTVNITLKEGDRDNSVSLILDGGCGYAVGTVDESGNVPVDGEGIPMYGNGKITVRYSTNPAITFYDNGITIEDGFYDGMRIVGARGGETIITTYF